jgi:phosphate transport system permease protein
LRLRATGRASASTRSALTLSLAAMAFGLFWLIWILFETVRLGCRRAGLGGLHPDDAAAQADVGGLANAIFGSLIMVVAGHLLIGTPIGILAGIYLAEYGQRGWLGTSRASSTTSCCRRRPS